MADPTEAESGQEGQENWSSVRKALEERASAAEEKAAGLERILAFKGAEAEWLTDVQIAAFNATYKGDMTAESVKAHIDQLGFSRPNTGNPSESPAPTQEPSHAESEATELAALSGGAPVPPPGGGELTQEAIDAQIVKAMNEGGPDAVMDFMSQNRDHFGI